jgi:hypothetical protein
LTLTTETCVFESQTGGGGGGIKLGVVPSPQLIARTATIITAIILVSCIPSEREIAKNTLV